jgi:hypothetical protein
VFFNAECDPNNLGAILELLAERCTSWTNVRPQVIHDLTVSTRGISAAEKVNGKTPAAA